MRSFFFGVALGTAFISSAFAAPSRFSSYRVKEDITPPTGWTRHSLAPSNHIVELRIALPQPNFHLLEAHLYEVSDPDHERYGQHLSKEEVDALVAPHPESIDAVSEWLAGFGLAEAATSSDAQDWVTVKVPVSLAEEMLQTKYHLWKHEKSGDYLVRTTSYSLPADLHAHVDLVQPTTMFGRPKAFRSNIAITEEAPSASTPVAEGSLSNAVAGVKVDASCNQTVTITCIQQLYNAVGYVPSAKIGNSIGIVGYLGEIANFQDLQSFYADQVPAAVGESFTFNTVNNGPNNQSLAAAGGEANLDVQFAFGLSQPIPASFFSIAGMPPFKPDADTPTDTNEPYSVWLDFILAQPNPPLTISSSYGDDEQTVPESFAKRVCAGFAQLGARGVSLLMSSGDGGVGDGDPNPATETCFTNDGKNVTKFIPTFPASCPFVTSVGATTGIAPEVAVSRFFSGGGFSNYFARPSFQQAAAQTYLNNLPKGTYAGLFNPAGRGIPDVAALGDRFRVFVGGRIFSIGGTSASSPTFAGIVALLNDARIKSGRKPLGFLNPFLYSRGVSALTDITIGHNSGCGTPGFNVTAGWDPVTGLGSPNFGKLKALVTTGL